MSDNARFDDGDQKVLQLIGQETIENTNITSEVKTNPNVPVVRTKKAVVVDASETDPSGGGASGTLIRGAGKTVVRTAEESDEAEAKSDGDGEGEGEDGEEGEAHAESEALELPEDEPELELSHLQLRTSNLSKFKWPASSLPSTSSPPTPASTPIRKLCLRQNLISSLEPLCSSPITGLNELDLYDNKVKDKDVGRALDGLNDLVTLDLSYNLLRNVPHSLPHLPSLKTVYFVQNRISKISNLASPSLGKTLVSLELGGNKIRKIEGLESLVSLEELWLGKNKITRLEGLETLTKLRILSIQSNRIIKLEGLENLAALEEFYISHNGLKKIEGLERNAKLRVLDIGRNGIAQIENLAHLDKLEEFWANDNQISSLAALTPQLGHISSLETVYLEGNPVQRTDMSGYRRKVMLALPGLKQIDATYVKI